MSKEYGCVFHSLTVLLATVTDSNQNVPLALVPFEKSSLNSTLALQTSKSFILLGEHKDFTRIGHLSVQFVKFFG